MLLLLSVKKKKDKKKTIGVVACSTRFLTFFRFQFQRKKMMSSLLTNVVRRQALTMVPRRQNSALLLVGPPLTKVTTKVRKIPLFFSIFVDRSKSSFLFLG